MIERKKFYTIFEKNNKDESLKLLADVIIKGKKFNRGASFGVKDGLNNVHFQKFRYFYLAIKNKKNGRLEIMGFMP